ncbi:MAG: PriCT-2 domain-containing protein, partial [Candidatus Fonsibacter sp.]
RPKGRYGDPPHPQPHRPLSSCRISRLSVLCLFISQLDNYPSWVRAGMILKQLGAPLSLWEEVSKMSNKYKHGDCARRWGGFHTQYFAIGSLFVLAKEGSAEMLERIKPTLNIHADIH